MGEPMSREGRIFAGSLVSFEKAFPSAEDVTVEFTEFLYAQPIRKGDFSVRISGGQMRCSNQRCFRGGYEFDFIIHDMFRKNETERQIELRCEGDEGMPKRRRGRSCDRSIKGTIKIKQKQSVEPTENTSTL
jgi:hypothetical protein